ncbi:MAG TPA: enoyl-CoA hydratase/isomerase family protein [Gemmatimonadales bacterium]|jgi:enoyl-CoA hydratase/carnithine racemase|nr:enoyl-CoA hydratase/isomerase family protein [Gemmatimonadales bacterium]
MSDELLYSVEGPVHRLTLNRPARRNALTPALARELALVLETIEEAAQAESVVLGGAGGHFCAGLDLHWLRSLGASATVAELQHGLSDFQAAVLAIVRCPVPVIAVVAGTAAGYGLDLALACDFRVAGAGASFTSAFARMGLVPDGGSTFTLPRLVGVGPALRLLLAGETLDAARAHAIGLVDAVVDDAALEAEVRRLTEQLSANAPSSVRTIKRLVRAPEIGVLEQALSTEGAAQIQALQGAEFRRRLESFTARGAARTDKA